MSSVSDEILAAGTVPHLEAIHGEQITVLTGPDAGKVYTCIREIEQDVTLDVMLSEDRRARRVIRFTGEVPRLGNQDRLQTADTLIWKAARMPGAAYLTTDFELVEVANGKDS